MPISEWKEGQEIEAVLWLVSGVERRTKDGKPFWEGTFRDASGVLPAKLWDGQGTRKGMVAGLAPELRPGAVRVKGRMNAYQGNLEIVLQEAKAVPVGEADPGLFAPSSERSGAEMVEEFGAVVASMSDLDYRGLLEAFRADREFFALYGRAPAATSMHHAWVGGLLEHSLALCRAARAMAPLYPGIDLDLLLAGCFLHDAGKACEIAASPGFEYTTDGRLFGHIYMGARLAERIIDGLPGFPEAKKRQILHLILSHQGDRSEGFGSPVDPMTPEAILFHHLDNLDAKLQNCLSTLKAAPAGREFTDARATAMRRSYFAGRSPGGDPASGPAPGDRDERAPVEESKSPGVAQAGLFGGSEPP
jgi:3'-5' exoribonuclease